MSLGVFQRNLDKNEAGLEQAMGSTNWPQKGPPHTVIIESQNHVPKYDIYMFLEHLQDGDFTTSLDSLLSASTRA